MSSYIAGWFSEMKIVRLFLCPDILKFICKYTSVTTKILN